MDSILITGALGFIGRALTRFLRSRGYHVTAADLAVRDYSDYVRADVTSYDDLYTMFGRNKIEMVIHMAGEVGRMVGEEHPQRMMSVNAIGTLNIVRMCLQYNCKLVYLSSSEVYGRLFDAGQPVTEEAFETAGSPFITTNIYALSKLFGETIVRHYVDNYDLRAVTIRPFMIYGPGEYPSKYRSAIANFVYRAITGRKLTVHKGAVRAWCYVSDFLAGLDQVMERGFSGNYEAFNIGSDEYHSMEEVAKMAVEEAGGKDNQIEVVEPPMKFLSLVKKASIEKVRALGYRPEVTLRQGLRNVVEWQKKAVLPRRQRPLPSHF